MNVWDDDNDRAISKNNDIDAKRYECGVLYDDDADAEEVGD